MFKNLYKKFCDENIVGRFIYANVAIYIIVAFIGVFATLFNVKSPVDEYMRWLEFPASAGQFLCQPWSLVTYMFLQKHHNLYLSLHSQVRKRTPFSMHHLDIPENHP